MKKWQNLTAPDDPASWYDVDGVWPTNRGSYETADFLSGTEITSTSAAAANYAWVGQTLSSTREFVIDAIGTNKISEYSGGTLTDRTNSVTVSAQPMFVAYGDVIIAAMGSGNATVKSTGTNFSALASSPNANIILTASNAVVALNTNTAANGWAASDVGDYTNWSTGEAASGTLYQTPGPITAGVAFGNDVFAFKQNAIYRLRYVGGVVKWTAELLVYGIGCESKYAICVGKTGILFLYRSELALYRTQNPTLHFYWFDGVSYPRQVNPLTALDPNTNAGNTFVNYDPSYDLFCVTTTNSGAPYNRSFFYSPVMDAWGKNTTPITNAQTVLAVPVCGDFAARANAEKSPQPVMWGKESANKLKRYSHGTPIGEIASSCYVESTKTGSVDGKVKFSRAIPRLRRKVDLGSDSVAVTLSFFRELHDTSTSSTGTASNSTERHRFDFQQADNFVRVKATYTAFDIEIDDLEVQGSGAGKN